MVVKRFLHVCQQHKLVLERKFRQLFAGVGRDHPPTGQVFECVLGRASQTETDCKPEDPLQLDVRAAIACKKLVVLRRPVQQDARTKNLEIARAKLKFLFLLQPPPVADRRSNKSEQKNLADEVCAKFQF